MSSELSLIVSNSFDAHCTAGTSVTQVIDINGIDIVADAGCELDIKNYARAEAECDMDGVIETLTGAILDSSTFAQTALRLIDRQTPCDSDDCVSSMRAALRNHLTMRCSSTVQAQQAWCARCPTHGRVNEFVSVIIRAEYLVRTVRTSTDRYQSNRNEANVENRHRNHAALDPVGSGGCGPSLI